MTEQNPPEEIVEDEPQSGNSVVGAVEYLLAFSWFYRRYAIGTILLMGVGYWIYVSTKPAPQPTTEPEVRIPQTEQPQTEIEITGGQGINQDAIDTQRFRPKTNRFSKIIQSGTKEEMLDAVLGSRDLSLSQSNGMSAVVLSDRLKVLRKLMTFELDETERIFTLTSYIETVIALDWSNLDSELALKNTRQAVEELDSLYGQHANSAVSGRANLSFVMIPGYEYLTFKSLDQLNEFEQRFDQRADKILNDVKSTRQLAEFVGLLLKENTQPEATTRLAQSLLDLVRQQEGENYRSIATRLESKILFGSIELSSLPQRVSIGDRETLKDVQTLFEGLKQAKEVHMDKFTVAVACVGAFYRDGQTEEAVRLNQLMEDAVSERPKDDDVKRILSTTARLKVTLSTPANR